MSHHRKPLQGLHHIIRFNWSLYALAIFNICFFLYISQYLSGILHILIVFMAVFNTVTTLASIFVSVYVYDLSDLYRFNYLRDHPVSGSTLNIHAGFDETSGLLTDLYPSAKIQVLDFYDPEKHTELSIRRARKYYPAFPGTISISTQSIPYSQEYADTILLIFAAHEIRNNEERACFFRELSRVLKPDGIIVVTEHLRDLPNMLAYSFGSFHFLPRSAWLHTFMSANLYITSEIKTTAFITTFILRKNGVTP